MLRCVMWLAVFMLALPLIYLSAAIMGAVIPAPASNLHGKSTDSVKIYLIANFLHADIAVPVNAMVRDRFHFLHADGFPLSHPDLKYILFGWGSRAFYTQTGTYADIDLATAWKAATGDRAVMRVDPAASLQFDADIIEIDVTTSGFENLLDFVRNSFSRTQPHLIEGVRLAQHDLFYEAEGHFNLLNPCNVWVSKALRQGGKRSGIWTPTTLSLRISNALYKH